MSIHPDFFVHISNEHVSHENPNNTSKNPLGFCCIIPVPLMCGFNELFYNKVQRFYSMELKKLEELELN